MYFGLTFTFQKQFSTFTCIKFTDIDNDMKSNSCFKPEIEYGVIISHPLPLKHNHCLASAVQQQDRDTSLFHETDSGGCLL